MKIVIIGCGNVGRTLAEQLSREGHDICVVDIQEQLVKDISNDYDVLGVVGNCTSVGVLTEAGVKTARILIAVTRNDETNLLCCLMGKKIGARHTIARVSDPNYSKEAAFLKSQLGLSMIINPQQDVAREIVKLMKFPSAVQVESFPRSRVEIVVYHLEAGNPLNGHSLREIGNKYGRNFLISAVERGNETIIPRGDFVLNERDRIHIMAKPSDMVALFKMFGAPTVAVRSAMVVGGGRTAVYMTEQLMEMGVSVTIVDKDREKCDRLSTLFPRAMVICGDCTDHDLLLEEGLTDVDAFVALTNLDEVNVMLSLYAHSVTDAKLVTRIHRIGYDEILKNMEIGSAMYPKNIASENILRYVRGLSHSVDSEMETLYRLTNSGAEALEFRIKPESPIVGKPLRDIKFRKNMLIASITHDGITEIPRGDSVIQSGDMVVLVTTVSGIQSISDSIL